ncbi:MAG: hypothetical protein JHC20_03745 [Pyrobaculum sp.]|nr:hypothetical protein [Pyrobaculum sp.]
MLNVLESNMKLGRQKAAALWLASFKRLSLRLAGGVYNSCRRQEDEVVNAVAGKIKTVVSVFEAPRRHSF